MEARRIAANAIQISRNIEMGFEVRGKTALITGANRGIGRAILQSVLQHGAAKVYAAVRNIDSAAPLVAEYGQRVQPVQVDLSQPETIRAATEIAADVQLVVNSAGVLRTATPLDDDAIKLLQEEIETNVLGLMRVAQAFAPILKANGGGALVQLNSVASMKCFSNFATYCASKAAAYSITQALRELLRDQGTLVISVHPGPIATDMATAAGLAEMADPPSVVAEGIVRGLQSGEFHLFPDSMARKIGMVYQGFGRTIVEANLTSG
jgi:NAD(P)-dependent dehydrogenase (short-subunit alcohol dehydrogenase family)